MLSAFLLALGTMCALSGALALVIVLADATVGNYGDCTLTVNGERTLVVPGGRPLLGTLRDQGIFIPSACGGRGSCGLCKCGIPEGAGDVAATELPWLSAAEREQRVRLSCQVKVKRDMQLKIPDELFSVRQYRAVLEEVRDLTPNIKEFDFKLLEPTELEFVAGQFVQVEVPPYELTDEPVYRAYSVASAPTRRDWLQLEVTLVPDGVCSTYLHKHLAKGGEVTLNGPYGDFRLHDSDRELLFIATGSGMAPIRAILQHMVAVGSTRRARFFFGGRRCAELFHLDELRSYERELPGFSFVPVLSRTEPCDGWSGEVGRVTDLIERYVQSAEGLDAYLCGNPDMIDSCVALLNRKGLPRERCYYDKFA